MLPDDKPYIIGETAFHHEGSVDFLKTLIQNGASCGLNALKFHLLFDLDDYMIPSHQAIPVLKKIIIPKENWQQVLETVPKNVDIVLLCNDVESLKWVNKIQHSIPVKAMEIHSTGLNDIFLLNEALNFNGTIILGVGGSAFEEVKFAVDFFRSNKKEDTFLMHGFQNYPTAYQDINFRRMTFLKEAFNLPIGYADHTDPLDPGNEYISSLPQVMGFNVLEKHFTHENEKRIDSQAAVSLEVLKKIIRMTSEVYATTGKAVYEFSEAEKKYGNTGPMKKAIVARRAIAKGTIVTLEDIAFKRTEKSSSLNQLQVGKIVGSKSLADIEVNTILDFSNIEFQFNINQFDHFFIDKK